MKQEKTAKFYPQALQHIYHRCRDKGLLFYSLEDRLVYYSLVAVHSKKNNVEVAAASLMFTHLHQSVRAHSRKDLSCYLRNTDSAFTRLYNHRYGRSDGQLFGRPVGWSQKYSFKDKKTNVIYVFNNHVEKGLCKEAVQERWSFLAYALSDHPFSIPLNKNTASGPLLKALRLVDRRVAKFKALEYCDLDRILPELDGVETEQFVDYVISRYAWVDFSIGISLFGSLDNMIIAINSTTGSEHCIDEDFSKHKDTGYVQLVRYAGESGFLGRIFSMAGSEKMDWVIRIRNEMFVPYSLLRKFFHYDFDVSR